MPLADALADPGHLLADIVDRLGGPPLGAGDPVRQPLGDAGDFLAKTLQRLSLAGVRSSETRFHGLSHAGDVAANLFDRFSAAVLDTLDAAAQGLGDSHHVAAHALDSLGRAGLGRAHVLAHIGERALHAVETGIGHRGHALGHLRASRVDAARQCRGHLFQARLDTLGVIAGFGRPQTVVQGREGRLQFAQRAGGPVFGVFQPGAKARDHRADGLVRLTLTGLDALKPRAHVGDRIQGAALAALKMAGDLAQRRLQRTQRLGGARPGLHGAQPLGDPILPLLGAIEALDHRANGLVDAADGLGRALFGGLDAGRQFVQRLGYAAHVVRGVRLGAR